MRARGSIAAAACAAAFAMTAGASAAPPSCPNGDLSPSRANAPLVRSAVLCLLNAQRTDHGLGALASNPLLGRASSGYAQAMVRERFFDHVSPDGSTLVSRVKATGYLDGARRWALAENIAWGSGALETPAQIVVAWMNSPGHRANILNPRYRDIGIGVADGAPVKLTGTAAAATYTTDFGMRARS